MSRLPPRHQRIALKGNFMINSAPDGPTRPLEQPLDLMQILGAQQDTIDRLVAFQTDATEEITQLRRENTDLKARFAALEQRVDGGV